MVIVQNIETKRYSQIIITTVKYHHQLSALVCVKINNVILLEESLFTASLAELEYPAFAAYCEYTIQLFFQRYALYMSKIP